MLCNIDFTDAGASSDEVDVISDARAFGLNVLSLYLTLLSLELNSDQFGRYLLAATSELLVVSIIKLWGVSGIQYLVACAWPALVMVPTLRASASFRKGSTDI